MEGLRNAPASVDFGLRADDCARFRGGFPAEPFERHPEQPLRVTQRAFAIVARAPS